MVVIVEEHDDKKVKTSCTVLEQLVEREWSGPYWAGGLTSSSTASLVLPPVLSSCGRKGIL